MMGTTAAVERLMVADQTDDRGTPPRQLIITVYGLYARESDGWLSVAALIRLLTELGVDEPAVRSSISRLKRREMLSASRRRGAAGYELSPTAAEILREGDERIFHRPAPTLADGWVLAVFSVPESERHHRHVLRTKLTELGFGTAAPGVWIAPAHLRAATVNMLERHGLDSYADVFHAHHLAYGDLTEKVGRWWDLDEWRRRYDEFLAIHEPAARKWRRRRTPREAEAFVDYVRVLTDWRRLPYLDPGLPAELLPTDWPGAAAADLFFALRETLADQAHAYVDSVT